MVDDPSEYVDVLLSDPVKKRAAQRELKKRLAARASAAAAPPATGNGNIRAGEKPAATVEAELRAPTLGDVTEAAPDHSTLSRTRRRIDEFSSSVVWRSHFPGL